MRSRSLIIAVCAVVATTLTACGADGGGGAKGWGKLFSARRDPYSISTTSGSFITTPLQADTGWTWKDFTLVGLFATDNAVFIVPPKSGIERWEQWVDSAK